MNVFFTICSNNYLAQAKVLGASLHQHQPGIPFYIFLCDKKSGEINYDELNAEVIAAEEIEPAMDELALKYNVIELNTCIKPHVVQYLFETVKADKVIYLDPDIKVFSSLSFLFEALETDAILLTPHIYTPIPIDGKLPGEHTFLNYGLYNLGFVALKNNSESLAFAQWWKEHTYKQGYIRPEDGIFVDQLPVNFAPFFFKNVKVMQDWGLNMAPWNLHERHLTYRDGEYWVNDSIPLKFYHFSSFKVDSHDLPPYYNRFTMKDRPDLYEIHAAYNEELKAAGHLFYSRFQSSYTQLRDLHLKKIEKQKKKDRLLRKFFLRK